MAHRCRLAGSPAPAPSRSLAGLDRNRSVLPRRTVESLNRGHIPQTFHSIGFGVASPVNRFREGIQFQGKLIHHFELLLEPSASDLAKKTALLFKSKRRIQRCPTLITVHLHKR